MCSARQGAERVQSAYAVISANAKSQAMCPAQQYKPGEIPAGH